MVMDIQKDFVTVTTAAEIMGCTPGRVRQMLRADEIEGEKVGERAWMVLRKAAEKRAQKPEGPGRPRVS